jgi:hypothetical protein
LERYEMKTPANASTVRRPLLGLCFLLPFLMGGCPEFRNDVVGVFETATRTALLGTDDEFTISYTARGAMVDATIDLIFDVFRTDEY